MINGCLTTLRNKFYEFNTMGQAVMTNLIAGIRSKNQTARDTFVQIVSGCLTAIRNKYTDFYNAGKYLVEGFADGITANTYLAEARARAMAAAAARAAERELDEHSPSKVGYRIGDFFGLAFVNAISDYADKSYKAGTNMAAAAKNGLSNAISKIREFVDGEMEVQPTIRPVLDLSEVRSGRRPAYRYPEQKPGDEDQFFDEPGNKPGKFKMEMARHLLEIPIPLYKTTIHLKHCRESISIARRRISSPL